MKKSINIIIPVLGLVLTGCGSTPVVPPVEDKAVASISVVDPKTEYTVDDEFVKPTVKAYNKEEQELEVTQSEVTFSGFDSSKEVVGQLITVTYSEKTTTYTVNINEQPVEDTFLADKQTLLRGHNYTAKVVSDIAEDPNEHSEITFYNIDDKAFFYQDPEYTAYYTGYINQKNKGIVNFDLLINGGAVAAQNFVATNPNLGVSMVTDYAMEYVLNANFVKDGESTRYKVSTADAVDANAILLNCTPYDVRFIQSGDYIYAKSIQGGIRLTTNYTITYIDEESVDIEEKTDHGTITVEITNIGNTHNTEVESYIANPTRSYPNPTDWNDDLKKDFKEQFNNVIPPFVPSASYSLKGSAENDPYTQSTYIQVEDYACGDQRNAYGALLDEGYIKSNYTYTKTVLNEEQTMKNIYKIEMTFYPTDMSWRKGTLGDYFPNGVFRIVYSYHTETNVVVTDVPSLNRYLQGTMAASLIPLFPDNGVVSKISKFDDRTAYLNQLYGDYYAFSTGTTNLFSLYIATKENAMNYINSLRTAFKAKGFTKEEIGTMMDGSKVCYLTDEHESKITLTYLDSATSYTVGYIQCGIHIYKASLPTDNPVLDYISVTGGNRQFTVGDRFTIEGATVTAHYVDSTETKDVTALVSLESEPNMSVAGNKSVNLVYTENGVTKKVAYEFKVIDSAIPEGAKPITYHLLNASYDYVDLQHVDVVSSTLPAYAVPGETVSLSLVFETGYYLMDVATLEDDIQYNINGNNVTFTMPICASLKVGFFIGYSAPEKTLESISVEDEKNIYFTGDEFEAPKVMGLYSDGSSAEIDSSLVSFSGYDLSSVGEQTVSVDYEGKHTSYEIEVKDGSITRFTISFDLPTGVQINITKPEGYVNYAAGTDIYFDVNNSSGKDVDKVTYQYGDNDPVELTKNFMSGKYKFTMPSANVTVKVTLKGDTPVTLTSIAVVDPQTSYEVGDTFIEPTVKATYSNGTTETVTGATFSGYDMSATGNQTVQVSYQGANTSYNITVSEPAPQPEGLVYGAEYRHAFNSYVDMILVFNEDGTGTYKKYRNNTSTTEATMSFSYTYTNNSIVVTLVQGDNTSFPGGTNNLRLFSDATIGTVNRTGVVNNDGTISFTMYGSSSATQTFTKVSA